MHAEPDEATDASTEADMQNEVAHASPAKLVKGASALEPKETPGKHGHVVKWNALKWR